MPQNDKRRLFEDVPGPSSICGGKKKKPRKAYASGAFMAQWEGFEPSCRF